MPVIKVCDEEGCTEKPIRCVPMIGRTSEWFCWDHAKENGYCPCCGNFSAGNEFFDFVSQSGLCYECDLNVRAENGEFDDHEDTWDMYSYSWHDPDMAFDDDDDTHVYIGQRDE